MRTLFFDLTTDLCCTLDFDGRITQVNSKLWEKTLGYASNTLVDSKLCEFIRYGDRGQLDARLREVRQNSEGVDFACRVQRRNGGFRMIAWRFRYCSDERLIYCLGRDESVQERLNLVLNAVPDPIFVKDEEHHWIIFNEQFTKLIGKERDELLGKSDYDFFPREQAEVFWAKDDEVFRSGQPNVNEEKISSPDGTLHTILTKKTLSKDVDGRPILVGIIRDVTEAKQGQEELVQAKSNLDALMNTVPDMMASVDTELRIETFNQRVTSLFKREFGIEIKPGMRLREVLPAAELTEWTPRLGLVLKGEKIEFECRYTSPSGHAHFYSVMMHPIRTGGTIRGAAILVRDVTREKEDEEKIRRSEQFLSALIENTPSSVYAKNLDGRFILVNEGYLSALGKRREELLGKTEREIWPNGAMDACMESDRKAARLGMPCIAEETITMNGKKRLYLTTKFPLRDENGRPYAICGISSDITERQRAQVQLENERARAMYSAKMATLGEMAAGIAHEINNPLAIINARASQIRLMLNAGVNDQSELLKACERIEATAMRISKIVRGLRSFAKDGTQDPVQAAALDVVVNDALEFCRQRFESRDVKLEVGPLPPGLTCECRPVQIGQVILNLLNNAFDAVQSLDEKWVRLEFVDKHDRIELAVVDSGGGIPSDLRDKLMQPFFTTKGPSRGTGLGLSISKGIVESHHGKLWIDSSHPNTRFVMELPKFFSQTA